MLLKYTWNNFSVKQNKRLPEYSFAVITALLKPLTVRYCILSVALYQVLKTVNRSTALTALFSRVGEGFIGTLSVACSVLVLWLINREDAVAKNQETVEFLFAVKDALMNLVFAFLGFGTILYCVLFYRSRYIPRWLAGFGMLAFLLVFGESILVILLNIESTPVTGVPAILFEITIGSWLLVKGVNNEYWENANYKLLILSDNLKKVNYREPSQSLNISGFKRSGN